MHDHAIPLFVSVVSVYLRDLFVTKVRCDAMCELSIKLCVCKYALRFGALEHLVDAPFAKADCGSDDCLNS